jgi:hypothetical protein
MFIQQPLIIILGFVHVPTRSLEPLARRRDTKNYQWSGPKFSTVGVNFSSSSTIPRHAHMITIST